MAYALAPWRTVTDTDDSKTQRPANLESLPPLDASGGIGVREITKSELLTLMSKSRPLSQSEKAQVDRGCPGLTCLYQGLGLTRWLELARGTRAYLRLEDALSRSCPRIPSRSCLADESLPFFVTTAARRQQPRPAVLLDVQVTGLAVAVFQPFQISVLTLASPNE